MSENKIIRFEEFRDYLLSWPQGGKKCAVCENNLFTLRVTLNTTLGGRDAGTDVGVAYSIPFAALEPIKGGEQGEVMITQAFPVLIRECRICGHMDFFSYQTVMERLESRTESSCNNTPDKGEENV